MTVSIIGCVVNGPGEALMTDIGLTGGGQNNHQIFIGGEKAHRFNNGDTSIVDHIVQLVEEKAAQIHAASLETIAAE